MTSRLASMLVQDGRVSARRMADAFQRQVIYGGTLDTTLLEMGLVDEGMLLDYLGRSVELPPASQAEDEPDPAAMEAARREFGEAVSERYRALPLGREGERLVVMVTDPPDRDALDELSTLLKEPIETRIGLEVRFLQARAKLYGGTLPTRFVTLLGKLRKRTRTLPPVQAPASPTPAAKTAAVRPLHDTQEQPPVSPVPASMEPPPREPPAEPPRPVAPSVERPTAAPPKSAAETPIAAPPKQAVETPTAVSAGPAVERPTAAPPSIARPAWPVPGRPHAEPRPPSERPFATTLQGYRYEPPPEAPPTEPNAPRVTPPPTGESPPIAAPIGPTPAAPQTSAPKPIAPEASGPTTIAPEASGPTPVAPQTSAPTPVAPKASGPAPASTPPAVAPVVAPPVAPPVPSPARPPSTPLGETEGLDALHSATERDEIFDILCRIARGRFAFAAVLTVQGKSATVKAALADEWLAPARLESVAVDLAAPSLLRTVVQSASPLPGRAGEDLVLAEALDALGRPVPLPAEFAPVLLGERVVAVIYADNEGEPAPPEGLGLLTQASAAAAASFLRIIQAAKKGRKARRATDASESRAPEPTEAGTPPSAATGTAAPAVTTSPAPASTTSPASSAAIPPAPAAATGAPTASTFAAGGAPAPASAGQHPLAEALAAVDHEGAFGPSAERLLADAETAACLVAERFPGPLLQGHRKLHSAALSLSQHGPLLELAARLGPAMVPWLAPRLADPSPEVRFHAALVLGELHSPETAAAIGRLCFDPDIAVRRAATHALGHFPPSPELEALLERLRAELGSDNLPRLCQVVTVLGELRDVGAIRQLIDLLTHRDSEVVDQARRALLQITKQDFEAVRWRWRSWLEKSQSQSRAEWLVAGLDQLSVEARRSAIEELSVLRTDRYGFHAAIEPREREWAARRYAAWKAQHPAEG